MNNNVNKVEDLKNDIDLESYILSLLKYWKLFLILIVLFTGLFGIKTLNSRVTYYYSDAQIYIKRSIENTNEFMDTNLSTGITNDFIDILQSDLIIDAAIKQSGVDLTIGQVSSMLTVKNSPDNQIITVGVNALSEKDAVALVTNIVLKGRDKLTSMYGDIMEILKLDENAIKNVNGDPLVKESIKGAIIGFALPFLAFSLLYLFNNKLRKVEDVERILDLPVICVVANVKERGKKDDKD